MRLDQYLFDNQLTQSRERARALIMAGQVYINGEKATKAGTKVPPDAQIVLREKDIPYVSRGGLKLEKAIQVFPIDLEDKICMDIGASSGGFTDCMLQNGAIHVYSIDVGYGQLDWKLRSDKRVTVMERTNIRNVTADMIDLDVDFFTADVSFISLKHIFPVAAKLLVHNAEGVCLIKPQFEAGREHVGKNGVVRDPDMQKQVVQTVQEYAVQSGFSVIGLDYSPIKGPKGNIEFLCHLVLDHEQHMQSEDQIKQIVDNAHSNLNN